VKRFKNILLLADQGTGGKAILRRAAALAKNNRAQLTVVDVIEELPRDMRMLVVAITPMKVNLRIGIPCRCATHTGQTVMLVETKTAGYQNHIRPQNP
jgi:nucleotide-binding universal stress UspA family protein